MADQSKVVPDCGLDGDKVPHGPIRHDASHDATEIACQNEYDHGEHHREVDGGLQSLLVTIPLVF